MIATAEKGGDLAQRVVAALLLAGCLGIALFHGVRESHGLPWPPGIDLLRDVAWAQTYADGRWFEDAFYAGETMSYVPLTPFVVSLLSRVTGAPVPAVYAQAGAYLMLLVPIALLLLAARWYGKWVALATIVAFIFLFNSDLNLAATYVPALETSGFAVALFFVSLVAYRAALASDSWKRNVLVGICLGLVFMTHVGSAVVTGGIVLLCEASRAFRTREWKRGLARLGTILGVALVTSTPLSASILGNYRLRVLNPDPARWVWPPEFAEIPSMVLDHLSPLSLFTLIGIAVALRGWKRRPEPSILAAWIVTAGSVWLWGFVWLAASRRGVEIPSTPVPSWHFLFYLKLIEPLLFGCGLVHACGWLAARMPERLLPQNWRVGASTSAVAVILVATTYSDFGQNFDTYRADADYYATAVPRTEIVEWIREHTTSEDVFLTHSAGAVAPVLIVGPAGRRVVGTEDPMFASAFVDWNARERDRLDMVKELRKGNVRGFIKRAAPYGVTLVLTSKERTIEEDGRTRRRLDIHRAFREVLTRELQSGPVEIYRFDPAAHKRREAAKDPGPMP